MNGSYFYFLKFLFEFEGIKANVLKKSGDWEGTSDRISNSPAEIHNGREMN